MNLGLVEKLVEQGLNKAQAAIALKVPRSGIPDHGVKLRESRRLDMATEMLAHRTQHADYALTVADALLAASEKEEGK